MSEKLDTGIKNVRNVSRYTFAPGSVELLSKITTDHRNIDKKKVIFFLDSYFKNAKNIKQLIGFQNGDELVFVSTKDEPSTNYIDQLTNQLLTRDKKKPGAIVGMGGGITMDVAKAVSNLLTNEGKAENYQGWDLLKKPGIYKIAVPTISGTGAEATRTCVLINPKSGIKLGMNSDFTVYDQLILDPNLTKTVPRRQFFYTGMDAYIHCIESLNGLFRNEIGDSYSNQTIKLCREVFLSKDMMSDENRSKMMVASYLGGCAIASSYVGVVHPFSAGLSVVLGIHHCLANCISMRAMKEFYPDEYEEFWAMSEMQNIEIPKGICSNLTEGQYEQLYLSTIVHEKPLTNALGDSYKDILTKSKVKDLFKAM
jgi:3-deoxy-alpha-D-manno-octulosonate 8-oxidase